MLTTGSLLTTCRFQSASLFFVYFGFLCFQVSSVSNFRPDTRGRRWSLTEAHLFSCAVGRGEQLQINVTGVCGECSQCIDCTGFAPTLGACAFPVYTAQAPGCAEGELSKAGPGLHAILRSKLLKFRFLGTPQRRRLSWACVLCPSQVRGAQLTRCLGTTLSQVCGASYHLPGPSRLVSWVCSLPCVSSGGLISGCGPPGRCQPSRIPGRLG